MAAKCPEIPVPEGYAFDHKLGPTVEGAKIFKERVSVCFSIHLSSLC